MQMAAVAGKRNEVNHTARYVQLTTRGPLPCAKAKMVGAQPSVHATLRFSPPSEHVTKLPLPCRTPAPGTTGLSGRAIIARSGMPQSPFNEEYVRKLATGDLETHKHFVSFFSGLLRVKLRTKLRSPELVEDVRQETFLRVFQSFSKETGGLQKPERLGAFINSTCNNV